MNALSFVPPRRSPPGSSAASRRRPPAQAEAWPAIQAGRHTLIAAPTGSGKTLAAFLAAIDALVRQGLEGQLAGRDPGRLRLAAQGALERHPAQPGGAARRHPRGACARRVCRTSRSAPGCAPATRRRRARAHARAARRTSSSPRRSRSTSCSAPSPAAAMLGDHAHGDRRRDPRAGARTSAAPTWRSRSSGWRRSAASACCAIGLSATQKPIEEVARFLVGAGADGAPAGECTIIDTGHRRARDLALEVPSSPLEAVMSAEVWQQVYDRLAELIEAHRTTLVFVNTRRLAERVTRAAVRAPGRAAGQPRTTAASPRSSGWTPSSGSRAAR